MQNVNNVENKNSKKNTLYCGVVISLFYLLATFKDIPTTGTWLMLILLEFCLQELLVNKKRVEQVLKETILTTVRSAFKAGRKYQVDFDNHTSTDTPNEDQYTDSISSNYESIYDKNRTKPV